MFEAISSNIGKEFSVNGQVGVYVGYIAGWLTFRSSDNHLFYTTNPLEILPVGFVPVKEALEVKETSKAAKVTTEEA